MVREDGVWRLRLSDEINVKRMSLLMRTMKDVFEAGTAEMDKPGVTLLELKTQIGEMGFEKIRASNRPN